MPWDYLLLALAGFAAGIVNAIAGGGTFLTFPALVWAGVPPVSANATSAVSVFPGYLGSALGYVKELKSISRAQMLRLIGVTFLGGLIGSQLMLMSSNQVFSAIVPFLLFFATTVFVYGKQIKAWAERHANGMKPEGLFGLFLVSIYGGYFNGGLGIVLLSLFALWGWRDIHLMNGLKSGLSFALTAISVTAYSLAGIVVWDMAVVMMVAAVIGGYAGAHVAKAIPAKVVRGIVTVIGYGMSLIFLIRLF